MPVADKEHKRLGQPRKYEPDELLAKFNEYMKHCRESDKLLPNIAGFCVFADMHRDTYYNYSHIKDYSDSIKRIETALEDSTLNCKEVVRSIFYLKNKFGYTDKVEQVTTIDINVIPPDERRARIESLLSKKGEIMDIKAIPTNPLGSDK